VITLRRQLSGAIEEDIMTPLGIEEDIMTPLGVEYSPYYGGELMGV
jgi:hypothetical protein